MLITKGSLGVASLLFVLLHFVPRRLRPAHALELSFVGDDDERYLEAS
jgi:hypothetical protein